MTGLRTVAPPRAAQHPGLSVSVTGPRRVIPGSTARYIVRVRNKRRGVGDRYVSSLSHLLVEARLIPVAARTRITSGVGRPIVRQLRELRHGTAKVLRIAVRVPRLLQRKRVRRVCMSTIAVADSARSAGARSCAAVAGT